VTAGEALAEAERRLAAAGVDTPRVDAELLVGHVLGLTRTQVYADRSLEVETAALEPLLRRREQREPLAYVLGDWGFRRLTLRTDERALVPRPETEVVVERALTLIAELPEPRVLDVGTGSGAIALAIADEHPGARVTGVDTSAAALDLARDNAVALRLEVELRQAGVEAVDEADWDLVVSNPPYVRSAELPHLPPELRHEPRAALVDVGLHEELACRARTGWLVLEAGDGQAGRISRSLAGLGYKEIRVTPDLAGKDRVVEGRRR
jgi:release factor glutamine methyltransferase